MTGHHRRIRPRVGTFATRLAGAGRVRPSIDLTAVSKRPKRPAIASGRCTRHLGDPDAAEPVRAAAGDRPFAKVRQRITGTETLSRQQAPLHKRQEMVDRGRLQPLHLRQLIEPPQSHRRCRARQCVEGSDFRCRHRSALQRQAKH